MFTPEHFKISNGRIQIMRKLGSASEYPEQQKIRWNNNTVLYIGTLSSILMLLIFRRKKKKCIYEKSCFSISVWMHYIKHFFSDLLLCFALSTFVFVQMLNPYTLSCVQLSDVIYGRVAFLCCDRYTTICLQYSWCPSLSSSPSPSHQSRKGIHITLKHPFRGQPETIPGNN